MDKDKLTKEMETRTLTIKNLEVRDNGEKGAKIGGYAAVFEQWATIRDRWGDSFQEQIAKGAFKTALENNQGILALYNHDWSNVLGRVGVNMTLEEDDVGLKFEIDLPDTSLARDLAKLMGSGIVNQCSFGAIVTKNDWKFNEDGDFRTLQELDLKEITITPIPAYPTTSAEVRSLKGTSSEPIDKEWEKRKAAILEKYSRPI